MSYKEKPILKKYFTPQEVADLIGISSVAVKDRDKAFGLMPKRNHRNHRKYSTDLVNKHVRIHHLIKVKGFTEQGAINFIKENGWK